MSDQSEANPKITQVADPRFKRLNDAFAKYLLAKEDHIGFLEDFVKAVIEHTPLSTHLQKYLLMRSSPWFTEMWSYTANMPKKRQDFSIFMRSRIVESCLIWKCKPTGMTLCSLESLFTFPSCMDRNKTQEKLTAILRL